MIVAALAACGDDTQSSSGTGGAGSGGAEATGGASSTAAPVAVSASSSTTTATAATTTGSGGEGGSADACGGGQGGFPEFEPTSDSIEFTAVSTLPTGEQILFNDWNAFPNTVATMSPAGADAAVVFEAYRVWSMGVSADGGTIAFASGDPEQVEHFGLTLGDAIQHTFLYDVATETAENLTRGNINEESHAFSADGERLYVSRRQDFACQVDPGTGGPLWTNTGYRAGRVDLASGDFEYLTPASDDVMTFALQPDADEVTGIFQWIEIATNTWSVRRLTLDGGEVELVRDEAGFPVVSPDGTRFLFNSYTDQGKLYVAPTVGDGPEVLVVDKRASTARWSPDGTRVVFLVDDDDISCAHVEIAAADGSESAAPTRIRDCTETDEFITELAWITR